MFKFDCEIKTLKRFNVHLLDKSNSNDFFRSIFAYSKENCFEKLKIYGIEIEVISIKEDGK